MSLLVLLTFLPLVGAVAIAASPRGAVKLQRLIALATTLAALGIAAGVWLGFDGAIAEPQLVASAPWFTLPTAAGEAQVSLRFGIDGLSILMVALTALLMPIVVLSSAGHVKERVKEFLVWLLVMQAGMFGVFLALDVVLFYFFWEVSLVPLYFMLGIWGSERRIYATIKFFLYTIAGSLIMLIAAIHLIWTTGTTDVAGLSAAMAAAGYSTQIWPFVGFALAFAIKVPMLPFHTWLPDAHTQAPTAGSVILAGVLLKMGTYGLVRFGIGMFPDAAVACAPYFIAIGAIGIVYGAFLALAQSDLKRLIACSSVSHLGYVVVGLFAMTQAGMRGGGLQMVNHGLSTGLLFLLVGMIYDRRHTRALDQYGGIATGIPAFALFFRIAVLSSIRPPGPHRFVGEYMILLGLFQASPFWACVSVTGVIFGAVYMLMATRRLLLGEVTRAENRELRDLDAREIGLMVPIVVLIVWIGVSPNTFLSRTTATLDALQVTVDDARAARGEGGDAPRSARVASDDALLEIASSGAEGGRAR